MWLPNFILPRNPAYVLAALALGMVLDYAYPYHTGIALKIHPVHTAYFMAKALGRPGSSRLRGAAVWAAVMATHLTTYGVALYLAWAVSSLAWVLVAAYVLKVSASLKLLLDTVEGVARAAARGDWRTARLLTQGIVRRDVASLTKPQVLSAAAESLAESLVDGFTSPLLYYALLGPLGALAQRVANTLDGALGFRSGGYERVGWVSAKADTVLNYVPARLTAALIIMVAAISRLEKDFHKAVACWLRNAGRTESVNAGHPMSALAVALGVRLEKPGHYRLECGGRPPSVNDLRAGISLVRLSAIAWLCLTSAVSYVVSLTHP